VRIPFIKVTADLRVVRSERSYVMNVADDQPRNEVVATRSENHDVDWIRRQVAYISKLPFADLLTVVSAANSTQSWLIPYMWSGALPTGLTLTGLCLRGPCPLFPQLSGAVGIRARDSATLAAYKAYKLKCATNGFAPSEVKAAMDRYIADLRRIIAAAPPVSRPMVLYRGWTRGVLEGLPGSEHVSTQFLATSFDVKIAIMYAAQQGSDGVIHRIRVEPGTRGLLVEVVSRPAAQVLLDVGTRIVFLKKGVTMPVGTSGTRRTRTVSNMIARPA
jgi:hypothetical protein